MPSAKRQIRSREEGGGEETGEGKKRGGDLTALPHHVALPPPSSHPPTPPATHPATHLPISSTHPPSYPATQLPTPSTHPPIEDTILGKTTVAARPVSAPIPRYDATSAWVRPAHLR